ncbi:hypothetical protein AVEN_135315-1 [Araneus ventricosus]|uniref:Tc3 transposase DNA binding domain-containing protein n=1 Tax=Araneus ventricosus TaxID=182803 RepID=A0A4Y2QYI8_ARAVE|nr:hypothetical protein AVEN_135315-1 [Araneus ventricosus]
MSEKCIRSVPASTMACFQDLSDFERGVIVGAREMGHSMSEVVMKFGFSRTTISRVYCEYRVSDKTSNFRHRCGRKKDLEKNWTIDVRRESLNETEVQYFLKFPLISMMGHLQMSACELFNGRSLVWALRVPFLTALHKALLLSWARQHYHRTVDDWKHVTLSDESRFQSYRKNARVRVWRRHH